MALGLGDRHLNNILISSINGGILHVDFDCILDKVSLVPVTARIFSPDAITLSLSPASFLLIHSFCQQSQFSRD